MTAHEPAYVHLREGKVARTVEVDALSSVMVDVDDQGRLLGVKTLNGSDWVSALATMAMDGRLVVHD